MYRQEYPQCVALPEGAKEGAVPSRHYVITYRVHFPTQTLKMFLPAVERRLPGAFLAAAASDKYVPRPGL